jgi:hypothetical protein
MPISEFFFWSEIQGGKSSFGNWHCVPGLITNVDGNAAAAAAEAGINDVTED